MGGYKNGKVEIFYGDNPPANLNILWQKRIVTNDVESTLLYEYNNNAGLWQIHNSNAIINGKNYINVLGIGTPSENAVELQSAYNKAKSMSPSASNIVEVVVAPGYYTFASVFEHDTDYINIVSSTGSRDVNINGIRVLADNSYIRGIKTSSRTNKLRNDPTVPFLVFYIDSNLDNLTVENCEGGGEMTGAWGAGKVVSGTFINCDGGVAAFGGNGGEASGNFYNCTSGIRGFAGNGIASGNFYGCTDYGEISGSTGDLAFGGYIEASGNFYNCKSFGTLGFGTLAPIISGKFYYCISASEFPTVTSGGKVFYCIGDDTPSNQ